MPEAAEVISLGAAFVAGISGSAHCFAMCGGLAGALGMRARTLGQSPQRSLVFALLTQIGRIASYAVVGGIAGATGGALSQIMNWVHVAAWLRVFAGMLLLLIAVRIAFGLNAFAWLESIGAKLWARYLARVAPLHSSGPTASTTSSVRSSVAQSLLMGAVWGWLPCGLVYSMVVFAVFAGSAWQGALIMMAFGVGTLPSMLSSSLLASQLARAFKNRSVRLLAAGILAVFGAWTIVSALQHQGHH
jgi:sulfite exporter TauE/SafE